MQFCLGGNCVWGCKADGDCHPESNGHYVFDPVCLNHKCVECKTNAECAGNTGLVDYVICKDNVCIEGCTSDAHCDPRFSEPVCIGQKCRNCRTDANCWQYGDTCVNNDCVKTCGYNCLPCCIPGGNKYNSVPCHGMYTSGECYDGICNSGPGMPCP